MSELQSVVAKAQAGNQKAIIAVVSGLVFLLTFVYILLSFVSAASSKKSKTKKAAGTVTKIEDGLEVRRSTRTPKAPKRWVPDSPDAITTAPETPTTATRTRAAKTAKTPVANGSAETPSKTPSRSLRNRTRA